MMPSASPNRLAMKKPISVVRSVCSALSQDRVPPMLTRLSAMASARRRQDELRNVEGPDRGLQSSSTLPIAEPRQERSAARLRAARRRGDLRVAQEVGLSPGMADPDRAARARPAAGGIRPRIRLHG